jgi:hypothetical protein
MTGYAMRPEGGEGRPNQCSGARGAFSKNLQQESISAGSFSLPLSAASGASPSGEGRLNRRLAAAGDFL